MGCIKNVSVTVTSNITDIDGQSERFSFSAEGTREDLDDKIVLRYMDYLLDNENPTETAIFISEGKVVISRKGSVQCRQVFIHRKFYSCEYGTLYGELIMGIKPYLVEFDFDKKSGVIRLEYDLTINHGDTTLNRVEINIRER